MVNTFLFNIAIDKIKQKNERFVIDNDTMRDLFENVLSGGQLAKEKSE